MKSDSEGGVEREKRKEGKAAHGGQSGALRMVEERC